MTLEAEKKTVEFFYENALYKSTFDIWVVKTIRVYKRVISITHKVTYYNYHSLPVKSRILVYCSEYIAWSRHGLVDGLSIFLCIVPPLSASWCRRRTTLCLQRLRRIIIFHRLPCHGFYRGTLFRLHGRADYASDGLWLVSRLYELPEAQTVRFAKSVLPCYPIIEIGHKVAYNMKIREITDRQTDMNITQCNTLNSSSNLISVKQSNTLIRIVSKQQHVNFG